MADIRKNLTLSAKLDDSELKKQLEVLKKEMNSAFSIDSGIVKDLRSAFKSVAQDFGKELQTAIDQIKLRKAAGEAAAGGKTGISQSDVTNFKVENMTVANLIVRNMQGVGQGSSGSGGDGSRGNESSDLKNRRELADVFGKAAGYAALSSAIAIARGLPGELTARRTRSIFEGVQGDELSSIATEEAQQSGGLLKGGGALAGAVAGALAGGAAGFRAGPLVAGIGAVLGGAYGAYKGWTATEEAGIESNKKQMEAINIAYKQAQSLNSGFVSMIRGGNVRGQEINNILRGGATYGFAPDESIQQFLSARSALGNKATVTAMSELQRIAGATGANVGTLAGYAEATRGAAGVSASVAAQKQAKLLENAFTRGLDASKTSKFLQSSMDVIQNTSQLGRIDADAVQSSFLNLASALSAGGPMTDRALEQAASLFQRQTNESNSLEGFAGLGNFNATQSYIQNDKIGQLLGQEGLLTLLNTKKGEDMGTTAELLMRNEAIKARVEKAGLSRQDIVDSLKNVLMPAKTDVAISALNSLGNNPATFLAFGLSTGQTSNEIFNRINAAEQQMGEAALRQSYESGMMDYNTYKQLGGMGPDLGTSQKIDQIGIPVPTLLDEINKEQGTTDQMRYKIATSQNQAEMAITGFDAFNIATVRTTQKMEEFKEAVEDATQKLKEYSATVGLRR